MLAVQSQMNHNAETGKEVYTTARSPPPQLGDVIAAESALWLDKACPELNEKRRTAVYSLKGGVLTAYCYASPEISDYRLRIVADYINYLFHLDNISDGMLKNETVHLSETVMNALNFPEDEPENEPNAARVARDMWRRCILDGRAGLGFQARFKKTLQLYFDSTLTQAQGRDSNLTPDLESYIEFRRDSSACKTTFVFLEYALGIDFPDYVVEDPHMRALDQYANDIDIWSYDMEQSRSDADYNMLTILMKYHGHTLQSASDHVGDLCDQASQGFLETRKNIPSWGPEIDDMVNRFVDGLENWIIGSVHWSFETHRYFGDKGMEILTSVRLPYLHCFLFYCLPLLRFAVIPSTYHLAPHLDLFVVGTSVCYLRLSLCSAALLRRLALLICHNIAPHPRSAVPAQTAAITSTPEFDCSECLHGFDSRDHALVHFRETENHWIDCSRQPCPNASTNRTAPEVLRLGNFRVFPIGADKPPPSQPKPTPAPTKPDNPLFADEPIDLDEPINLDEPITLDEPIDLDDMPAQPGSSSAPPPPMTTEQIIHALAEQVANLTAAVSGRAAAKSSMNKPDLFKGQSSTEADASLPNS
ncbi:hypothetical protein D9757_009969 [Collybiopsis confluens]|uniref:Terpene synthase n=1 Tax=Collybiopsis confluens TaxID=2823264 RepID=A0A8H5H289_9AGAR|nr:hypothetical protein D9757_009969 [Collybiopsis confluens]